MNVLGVDNVPGMWKTHSRKMRIVPIPLPRTMTPKICGGILKTLFPIMKIEFYTVTQAAKLLQMHPESVRQLINSHELGAFRKGPRGRFLISQKQIDAFLVPAGADWKSRKPKK